MAKIRIDRRKEYREQLRLLLSLSRPLINQINSFNDKFKKRYSRVYRESGFITRESDTKYFADLFKILSSHVERVSEAMIDRMKKSRLLQKQENLPDWVNTYINEQTAQDVALITDTTRRQIATAIEFGLSEGATVFAISKIIEDSTAFSPQRAKLIARTETHSAMNYASYQTARELSLVRPVKEWISALDDRTRDWHGQANGQLRLVEDSFTIFTPQKGGASVPVAMRFPGDTLGGPANVVNCRCFAIYYDEEDVVGGR